MNESTFCMHARISARLHFAYLNMFLFLCMHTTLKNHKEICFVMAGSAFEGLAIYIQS